MFVLFMLMYSPQITIRHPRSVSAKFQLFVYHVYAFCYLKQIYKQDLSLSKNLGPHVFYSFEFLRFRKVTWCIFHLLHNTSSGLGLHPQTWIFLQQNVWIFTQRKINAEQKESCMSSVPTWLQMVVMNSIFLTLFLRAFRIL